MSVWFLLWAALSAILIYFLGWMLLITYQQKKAWRTFAERYKLRYRSAGLTSPPLVDGVFDGYEVALFTENYQIPNQRTLRKLTAIEVKLKSVLPMDGGVASGGLADVLQHDFDFPTGVLPKVDGWDSSYVARTNDEEAFNNYFTPKRWRALLEVMKLKNSWVVFAFKDGTTLLRLDVPYALEDPAKLNRLMKRLVVIAKVLELQKSEEKAEA